MTMGWMNSETVAVTCGMPGSQTRWMDLHSTRRWALNFDSQQAFCIFLKKSQLGVILAEIVFAIPNQIPILRWYYEFYSILETIQFFLMASILRVVANQNNDSSLLWCTSTDVTNNFILCVIVAATTPLPSSVVAYTKCREKNYYY